MTNDGTFVVGQVRPVEAGMESRIGLSLVVWAWVAFSVAHTAVRIIGNGQLGAADGLSMMAAQELNVAYQAGQPPLYDWTLWLIQQVTGPTAFSAYLNKYSYMTLAGVFVYLGANAATDNRTTGAIASLSLMVLFNVGISIHDQSTHSVAMIAALAATYYAFVMIAERGAWRDYVVLGLAVGFGILSKYGYVLMPGSFVIAFLCSPALRGKILSLRFGVAIAIALALILPFMWWLLVHKHELAARTSVALVKNGGASYLARVASGIARLIGSFVVYATPAIPILWAIWPQLLLRGVSLADVRAGSLPAITGLAIAIALGASILLVLISGVDFMRSRYMHVLGLLLPVFALTCLKPEEFTRAKVLVFLAVLFVLQIVPIVGRALAVPFPVPPFCSSCNIIQPIDKLGAELEKRGFGNAVIRFDDENARLGGNLLRYLPHAVIRTNRLPTVGRDAPTDQSGCLKIDEIARGARVDAKALEAGDEVITAAWPRGFNGPPRETSWIIRRLPAGDRGCRSGK